MSEPVVPDSYVDAFNRRRAIEPNVRGRVLAAMGLDAGEEPSAGPEVAIVSRGEVLPAPGDLVLEDGTALGRYDRMPVDAPFGYHHLHRDDGIDQLLLTGPGRCHVPPHLRAWGWAIQLPATRSTRSWGIGDLDDLRRLAERSAAAGAGFIAVGPLGAPNPGPNPEPSPYYPSTRRFGDPLAVSLDAVGADADLVVAGRALNASGRVDRSAALSIKRRALELAWASGMVDRDDLERWRGERGEALERWAAFCVLSETYGPGWRSWPVDARTAAAVDQVARRDPDAAAFHAWIQRCFDDQLAAASRPLRRIADMPIGVDPGGFDAWEWQDQLAIEASIGAPPDRFNPAGQDWSMPPFIPHRLREAQYRPFIETIRALLRHAGGLRMDHVLGLFRLWWVPAGADPVEGAYVRYPTDELLEIIAIESHRAHAVVIGEDLGTVPPGVRRELRRRAILSTRLALFERVPPSRYPRATLAGVTTHDLPTIAGTLSGADLADQATAGIVPDAASLALLRRRLLVAAGLSEDAPPDQVAVALHHRLAAGPPMLVAATLEDALGAERRPNLPGTTAAARDNWSIALPLPIEAMSGDPRLEAVVRALNEGRAEGGRTGRGPALTLDGHDADTRGARRNAP